MELKVTPWDQEEAPTVQDLEEQFAEQDLRVYHWSSSPEDILAAHTHGYHKILYVVEGSIKFEFPTRHKSFNLTMGDRLELPAGIRHSAVTGVDGVICLEAHLY